MIDSVDSRQNGTYTPTPNDFSNAYIFLYFLDNWTFKFKKYAGIC